ncbi:hypothetical protein Tco_0079497 [Tanacetum coccineum]
MKALTLSNISSIVLDLFPLDLDLSLLAFLLGLLLSDFQPSLTFFKCVGSLIHGGSPLLLLARFEYGVSYPTEYGVSSSLSNTAYSSQQINTALDELRSSDFNLLSDKEYSEEEEAMAETMEQYMSKTRTDYGSGVTRPKIDNKDQFELKGQFLKELRENTFSGSDNEDANEHIEKVLEIVDLFHVPNITVDQLMLRVFPISLTGAASRWLRNEPTGSIKT